MPKRRAMLRSAEELEPRDLPSTTVTAVADINSKGSGSVPAQLVVANDLIYFKANDGSHGSELWRTDGSISGTQLVADIRPGGSVSHSDITNLTNAGNRLYFQASNGSGSALWTSDGTSTGTQLAYDLVPGSNDTLSGFTALGNKLIFIGYTAATGSELWASDGTSTGTLLLKDILSGNASSGIKYLTAAGSLVYFSANDGSLGLEGFELWQTDGTVAGTRKVQPGLRSPRNLVDISGQLFFTGYPPASPQLGGIWKSDGTSTGTVLVTTKLYDNVNNPAPSDFTNVNGTLFFAGGTPGGQMGSGTELWKSDGTSAGTVMVRDINTAQFAGSYPSFMVNLAGQLYFNANSSGTGYELWTSDGTSSGTHIVQNIRSGSGSSYPVKLTPVSDGLYFLANGSATTGHELWYSDGTSDGTRLVRDVIPGSTPLLPDVALDLFPMVAYHDSVYFAANEPTFGYELWRSTGPGLNAQIVADIRPGGVVSGSSNPNSLTNVSGMLFFAANDGTLGNELWRTSGRPKDTQLLAETQLSTVGAVIGNMTNVAGRLFFTSVDTGNSVTSRSLWTSDGTANGTVKLNGPPSPGRLSNVGGRLFFSANSAGDELWTSDGTSTGTLQVADINPGSGSATPSNIIDLQGTAIFRANNGTSGLELWRSDGTSSGTTLLRDIMPGTDGSGPGTTQIGGVVWSIVSTGSQAFFWANDGVNGFELWRTDGTSSGTMLVKDILPGAVGQSISDLVMVNVNGVLYFAANDGVSGQELWRSDGTSSGTERVADIRSGNFGSSPIRLTNAGGVLYFAADDGVAGLELWRCDPGGSTTLVRDIRPGSTGSAPEGLTVVSSRVFFAANDGITGLELWESDGTSTGTTLVTDLRPGSQGGLTSTSFSPQLVENNGFLYFSGNNGTNGIELWRAESTFARRFGTDIATITTSVPSGTYSTGQSIPIVLNFREPMRLSKGVLTLTLNTGAMVTIAPFTGLSASATYTVGVSHTAPRLSVASITLQSGAWFTNTAGFDASTALPVENLDRTSSIIVNPLPPTTVSSVLINAEAVQQSRLTTITLQFATPIDAALLSQPGAIQLIRNSTGTVVETDAIGLNGRIVLSPSSGAVSNLTLTFDNPDGVPITAGVESGSLADGRWQLLIPYLQYSSPVNDPKLRRFFGDADGNGTINADDFAAFGNHFGQLVSNSPFDFNNDGTVNAIDFAEFGNRFGMTL